MPKLKINLHKNYLVAADHIIEHDDNLDSYEDYIERLITEDVREFKKKNIYTTENA